MDAGCGLPYVGVVGELIGTASLDAIDELKHELGDDIVAPLLRTASCQVLYSGQTIVHAGESRRAGILLHGLLRSFVRFPCGGTATVDYMRGTGFYGLATLFHPSPATIDALKTSSVLLLDSEIVSRLAADRPSFALYLARQLAHEVAHIPAIVEEFAVMTVSERVAAHLLAISERETLTGPRVAHVTQQLLAEFVGSAREVVARCLHAMREDGLVALARHSVYVTDEPGLARLASHLTGAPASAIASGRRAAG